MRFVEFVAYLNVQLSKRYLILQRRSHDHLRRSRMGVKLLCVFADISADSHNLQHGRIDICLGDRSL